MPSLPIGATISPSIRLIQIQSREETVMTSESPMETAIDPVNGRLSVRFTFDYIKWPPDHWVGNVWVSFLRFDRCPHV